MKCRKWLIGLTVLCVSALIVVFTGCINVTIGGNSESSNHSESSGFSESSANQDEELIESLKYQKISGKEEYRVIGIGDVTDADLVIPATYDDLPVTEIAAKAFAVTENSATQNYYIESVTVPDTVKRIDKEAFAKCENLTSVTIDGGEIGEGAFLNCKNLASVMLGENVTAIGKSAFSGCNALSEIHIPNKVTAIEDYTFYECAFTEITLGDNITWIGKCAFFDCSKLTDVVIGSGAKTIGELAFV